jgi:hypothetical protein
MSFTCMAWMLDLPVLTSLALPTVFAAVAIFRLRMSVIPILAPTAAQAHGRFGNGPHSVTIR